MRLCFTLAWAAIVFAVVVMGFAAGLVWSVS